MAGRNEEKFKTECIKYFSGLGIYNLRSYGRHLGLRNPTVKKKTELIEEILEALCGGMALCRGKKGAPVKNHYVDPQLVETVERLKKTYLPNETRAERADVRVEYEWGTASCTVSAATEENEDYISMLTKEQREQLNAFLKSLK